MMAFNLKKILKEVAIFAVIVLLVSNLLSYFRAPKLQSNTLPQIEVQLLNGETFSTRLVKAEPFVLHFWATWCPTCKAEASNIQSISKSHKVLTVAVKSGSDEALKGYMRDNGYDFDVVNDSKGILAEQFKVGVFPTTFIFDAQGELKFTETGYTTTLGLETRLNLLK